MLTNHLFYFTLSLLSNLKFLSKIISYSQFVLIQEGHTPLSRTLISDRHDVYNVIESLLANGADVNLASGPEREYPLNLVMKHVSADMAELVALRLIQHGADPNLRDKVDIARCPISRMVMLKNQPFFQN